MMMLLLQTAAEALANPVPVTDPAINGTVTAVAHQAGLVAITVWGLEFLKRWKAFRWINANTGTVTRIVSTLAALAAALAVQISVTGDASTGWHGTFAIPSVHILWDSFIRFAGQKMGQEGLYRLVYDRPQPVIPVRPEPMDAQGKPIEVAKPQV